jgi:hypothetical protein
MAIHAGTHWEVRTTGSDTNGGGFSATIASAGTDYSQQDSAQLSVTDAACSGTTTLTSATGGFTAAMIGNLIYLSSGPGWYTITTFVDANTVTLDRVGPSATGMTANVGGALATPGRLSNLPATKNRCWIKNGTYTITTSTPGPSGPYYQSSSINVVVEGYGTTRGDGIRPVVSAGAVGSIIVFRMACSNQASHFRHLEVNANGQSGVTGFSYNASQLRGPYGCKAIDCVNGFNIGDAPCVTCIAEGCDNGFPASVCIFCIADTCITGFPSRSAFGCVAVNCTTGFFAQQYNRGYFANSTAYNCVTGFKSGTTVQITQTASFGCISHTCITGFEGGGAETYWQDCATYNCTSSTSGSAEYGSGVSVYTADPFVDAAGGDFTMSAGGSEITSNPWLNETWVSRLGAVPPLAGGGVAAVHPLGGA